MQSFLYKFFPALNIDVGGSIFTISLKDINICNIPETDFLVVNCCCDFIVQHASGRKFQEILEEAFVRPLGIEGELYVGIPPGMNSQSPPQHLFYSICCLS